VWQCVLGTKHGKHNCPHSKGIDETIIEDAFVRSYQLMCGGDNKDVLSEFLSRMETSLKDNSAEKQLAKVKKSIKSLGIKSKTLLDNLLDGTVTKSDYTDKKTELDTELIELEEQRQVLQASAIDANQVKLRLEGFKRALEANEILTTFDKHVFEAVVDRVIIGSKDEDENIDPQSITFVYKTGLEDKIDGKKTCSYIVSDTYRVCRQD
jgi:hypothetical protein